MLLNEASSKKDKQTLGVSIFILILLGIIVDIEVINNILLRNSNVLFLNNNLMESAKLLRMELWPIHLGAGILMSLSSTLLFFLLSSNKIFKALGFLMFSSGLCIFFIDNSILLVIHIISSAFVSAIVLFEIFKNEKLYFMSTVFFLSMFIFLFFIMDFIFYEELVLEHLFMGARLTSLDLDPTQILNIYKLFANQMKEIAIVLFSIIFSGWFFTMVSGFIFGSLSSFRVS